MTDLCGAQCGAQRVEITTDLTRVCKTDLLQAFIILI